MSPLPLDVRPDVAAALKEGRPVVAMASAPIAHSLPWPDNHKIAKHAEAAAEQEGAVLAVLAVWKGRLTVGLPGPALEELAKGANTLRANRRDLATAVAHGSTASTTVAASLYLAHRAGIPLLVAGAIGGASETSIETFTISADLRELARVPVAVVTGGTRTVSDLSRTAEILESHSVPVIGYDTDSFPAFYQRPGSQRASVRANTPAEVAALLTAHWDMDGAGAVIALPTPDNVALTPDEIQPALREVSHQATNTGVRTRDLPPVLMDRLNRMTKGRALRAYSAILVGNAKLAAQIARELAARLSAAPAQ